VPGETVARERHEMLTGERAMETAQSTTRIALPVQETRRRWERFTGEAARPAGEAGARAEVAADQVPGAPDADKGMIHFDAVDEATTEVTLELRYNPTALAQEGLDATWVAQRIGMYLDRFKRHAEEGERA